MTDSGEPAISSIRRLGDGSQTWIGNTLVAKTVSLTGVAYRGEDLEHYTRKGDPTYGSDRR